MCVVCAGVHVTEHLRSQDNFEELVLSFHLVLLPVPCSWPGSFWVTAPLNLSRSRSAGITTGIGFFQVHSNVEKEDVKSCALERPQAEGRGTSGDSESQVQPLMGPQD